MSTSTQVSRVSRKKSKKNGCCEGSSISDLPDWAVSHILSLLPTKDAVKTSVLSKDWEYKWTFIYNIKLDDRRTYKNNRKKATFANFVERTLYFSRNIESFHLSCYRKYDLDRMKAWISAALTHDVHYLQIFYREGGIVLPRNLLNCYSLRKLDLNMPCTFKIPAKICFLHLTTLRLEGVEISNELSTSDQVKFNLPVVKTFELIECKWLNVKLVDIYAPKMTSFESETRYDAGLSDYTIKITGDSLLRFKSRGGLPENIVLSGSPVIYAVLGNVCESDDLYHLEKSGLQIRKLLEGLLSLKDLELSGSMAMAIAQSKLGPSLPRFYNVERLVFRSHGNAEALVELLRATLFLKFLVIDVTGWSDDDYDYDDEYIASSTVSDLEEIKFNCFAGEVHELKLAKFFLKNASQLKRICLSVRDYPRPRIPKNEIAEELSTYPKASTCLTIIVS